MDVFSTCLDVAFVAIAMSAGRRLSESASSFLGYLSRTNTMVLPIPVIPL